MTRLWKVRAKISEFMDLAPLDDREIPQNVDERLAAYSGHRDHLFLSKPITDSWEADREKLQERLAKLVGGVALIKVGAATETEMKEKKARVKEIS